MRPPGCQRMLMASRDWKKLTFYYFADEYINFNSLVTDLFKIYKTRIWMSAINPASFQTPLSGIQIPGGNGSSVPHMTSTESDHYPNRRQQRQHQVISSSGGIQPGLSAFDPTWNEERDSKAAGRPTAQQLYGRPFPGQDLNIRPLDPYSIEYRQNLSQALGMSASFTPGDYHAANLHHSPSFVLRPESGDGMPPASQLPSREWNPSFQGLSLGH